MIRRIEPVLSVRDSSRRRGRSDGAMWSKVGCDLAQVVAHLGRRSGLHRWDLLEVIGRIDGASLARFFHGLDRRLLFAAERRTTSDRSRQEIE
jgi:hypothetical protein